MSPRRDGAAAGYRSSRRGRGAAPAGPPAGAALPRLPGEARVERLGNGLTVALVDNPQAPIVATALVYRVGTRDEAAGQGGIAHFLEHMMFKGSERYGPGEVDRRTQELGGSNNAYTSHDATAYYFELAADRWGEALAIEADRMTALALDPGQVESERRVILEEIAMYRDDPWDHLSERVEEALHAPHAYGRPVLGTRDDLVATGRDELAAFHHDFYRPGNAVLAVGGDLGGDPAAALAAVERAFGGVASRPDRRAAGAPAAAAAMPKENGDGDGDGAERRLTLRRGEVARLLVALRSPAADDPDFPAARVLAAILGSGRSSRLHRLLVDEKELCRWASAGLLETLEAGTLSIGAELLPGVEPERVEREVTAILDRLAAGPPAPDELERARRVVLADWTFGHERILQQTMAVGFEVAFFEPGWTERQLAAVREVDAADVERVARRLLAPERRRVIGWSLPAEEGG